MGHSLILHIQNARIRIYRRNYFGKWLGRIATIEWLAALNFFSVRSYKNEVYNISLLYIRLLFPGPYYTLLKTSVVWIQKALMISSKNLNLELDCQHWGFSRKYVLIFYLYRLIPHLSDFLDGSMSSALCILFGCSIEVDSIKILQPGTRYLSYCPIFFPKIWLISLFYPIVNIILLSIYIKLIEIINTILE